MELVLYKDHTLRGNGYLLGLVGENKSEVLNIIIKDSSLLNKWAYIEFKNNDSPKWSTPRLEIIDGVISYPIVSGLLIEGKVKIQVVFRDIDGFIWKSFEREFVVGEALCVSEDLPVENPEFITEAQKLLDECEAAKNGIDEVEEDLTKRVEVCEEVSRVVAANEATRIENENNRILNEVQRQVKEEARIENEESRSYTEGLRVEAENARKEAETLRQANEILRQSNEAQRQALNRLFENLSIANEGKTYSNVKNDLTAYQKANPSNVLPHAIINRVGGMSYVEDNAFKNASVSSLRSVGKNLFDISKIELIEDANIAISKINDNSITITTSGNYTGNGFRTINKKLKDLAPSLEVGKTYILTMASQSSTKALFLSGRSKTIINGQSFTLTKEDLESAIVMYGLNQTYGDGTGDCIISNIQIEEGTQATEYEPYKEYSLAIPSEVQALDGYGLGINETYHNYIDLKNRKYIQRVKKIVFDGTENWIVTAGKYFYTTLQDIYTTTYGLATPLNYKYDFANGEIFIGKDTNVCYSGESLTKKYNLDIEEWKTYLQELNSNGTPLTIIGILATPIETDISEYLTEFLLQVEENGSITFENEYKLDTPSSITYQTKL